MGKMGTVTDPASISLRSISAGLKLNTPSCSTLLSVYSYFEIFSSQAKMLTISTFAIDNHIVLS